MNPKLLRAVAGLFFDKRLLAGRWFDERRIGWLWVAKGIWFQKVLGFNRGVPVPTCPTFTISNFSNLVLGRDNLNNFQSPGVYLQNYAAKIHIGDDCFIAPNVGIITTNHDPSDPRRVLDGRDVRIGHNCWIGMNTVILPGVELGDATVVGAGSVVTRSFPEGAQIIAGNPAKIVRKFA